MCNNSLLKFFTYHVKSLNNVLVVERAAFSCVSWEHLCNGEKSTERVLIYARIDLKLNALRMFMKALYKINEMLWVFLKSKAPICDLCVHLTQHADNKVHLLDTAGTTRRSKQAK